MLNKRHKIHEGTPLLEATTTTSAIVSEAESPHTKTTQDHIPSF